MLRNVGPTQSVMRIDPRTLPFFVAFAAAACAPFQAEVPGSAPAAAHVPIEQSVVHGAAPEGPSELGKAPEGSTEAQRLALWWVNTYREQAGLGPVGQLTALNEAARDHADYVLMHPDVYDVQGLSVHEQLPDHEGYSGSRFWERMEAAGYDGHPFREVIAYQSTPEGAVAHWMETVYHRLPIIHPSARHIGYAQARIGSSRINVLDLGSGEYAAPKTANGIAWPTPGAFDVPLSWDGLESPKPQAPPNGYPSGPVITLTFGLDAAFEVIEHTIIDVTDDTAADTAADTVDADRALPHVLLTPENDPHLKGESAIALYTHDPLHAGRTYEVRVMGILDGATYERSWTFSTRESASCDVHSQDCGPGKGCYATSAGAPVCAWAGDRAEGHPCGYQNDCGAGLTCVGQVCRRYCSTVASADSAVFDAAQACSATCGGGHSKLNVAGEVGACKI